MLTEWLAPDDLGWFMRSHFQAAPLARAGSARAAVPALDWPALDRLLGSDRPLDLMTVRAGRLQEAPRPRSLEDARALMRAGVSVVVRSAERHDPGLRAVAAGFERALPGEVHVQVYATPAGTNSYGWHYDFEDVFIAQTAGVKDYYFRANTVARDAVLGDGLDFTGIRRETSPIYQSRLIAGDWLYIPSTWWHLVKCAEDALSISVGVMPPEALRNARRLPPGWTGGARPRD
ncbi:MAG TPA: cupin domain-containing protein [Polyangia bacterium]|nr:cupin domain-containing protein [Polyangia bacterium]